MKEYWINYWQYKQENQYPGAKHSSKEEAYTKSLGAPNTFKVVYRIHVKEHCVRHVSKWWPNGYPLKMVDGKICKVDDRLHVQSGGRAIRPKYEPLGIHEKWMDI